MKARILLVEDDPDMRRVTKLLLQRAGHEVVEAGTAEEGLSLLQQSPPDLLVSDIQLPGLSGLKSLEILRQEARTARLPIILLTVMGKGPDKVRGLRLGADDYITKPYDPPEFLARVEAVLRRGSASLDNQEILEYQDLRVDVGRREATLQGRALDLRKKEFELLVLFLKNRGKLLTRDRIGRNLWGDDTIVTNNTLSVHLKSLRDKLGAYGAHIETYINEGYRFID